jgi:predicted aspartyl protease
MSCPTRRWLLGALPALGLAAPAFAQKAELKTAAGEASSDYVVESWLDMYGRPTARVTINGQGPFQFMVDTGSTTTVIADRHVATLGVTPHGRVTVIGATGSASMPLLELESLRVGAVDKRELSVAVLPDRRLGREDGILGADVFAGRRLVFDIREKIVRIEPSKRQARGAEPGNMRIRNGLLAEIDGRVGNIPARLMLDTGAKSCVANRALSDALLRQYPRLLRLDNASISGVTGHKVHGQFVALPKVDMRAFTVQNASCIAADAPVFELWGLNGEPAMIVGVDLLSRLDSFSIDYGAQVFDAKLALDLIARNSMAFG